MTTAMPIIILCGLVIALALYQLYKSVRKISRGECCEGCGDCAVQENCSSRRAEDKESE